MILFHWKRSSTARGVVYFLHHDNKQIGQCFYMPGSKRYLCIGSAPVKNGAVLTEYWGGSMRAAMDHLERDWCKRSIGLFGEDDIDFIRPC